MTNAIDSIADDTQKHHNSGTLEVSETASSITDAAKLAIQAALRQAEDLTLLDN